MSSVVVLPGPNRHRFARRAAPVTAALCIIAFALFGGSSSAEAVTSAVGTGSSGTGSSGTGSSTLAQTTPVQLDSADLPDAPAVTGDPVETIATTRRAGAVPCALIAILLLCGGVFVRLFVAIRLNSRRGPFAFTGGSDFSTGSSHSTEFSRDLELSGIPTLALTSAALSRREPLEY